ncbi:MAG TPA: hypothetical protein VK808_06740 [Bacteroidia bacterium]|nr:hypothetical protein [Bacteroidia bacterium]
MGIKRKKIIALFFCLTVFSGIFLSCRKNGQPSWDTQILAPIVSTTLSINDIVTSSYIKSNPADSLVSLVYTDSLYNLNLDTLLNIPDTVFRYDTVSPLSTTISPGGLMFESVPNPTYTTYNLGGVELVNGILQSGYMVYTITNPLSQPLDYLYTVPNITKNSNILEIKLTINAGSTITDSIFLGGYHVDFTGPTHNGYNIIATSIQVNLDPGASALSVTAGDRIVDANITFKKVIPYYAQGYFGTSTKYFGPENVGFPVFSKIISGSLNLQNVNVNLTLTNGFGVDASLKLVKLTSNRLGDTIYLGDPGVVGSTINVNRATKTNNPLSPVNPVVMNFALNPSNSNILNWIDNLPSSVGYALQVTTDPLGNVSGFNDFVYYGYGISSAINMTVPLSLIATNLTLADTLAVNFGGTGSQTKQVKSGKLTIYASNGFPFSAGLQMYLLNQNNVVFDSIFIPTQTIAAGIVNPSTGKVTTAQNSVLTVSLDVMRTQELFNTKNAILYAKFNMGSLPSTYVSIYSNYQLGLKLVGNFDYLVN